MCWISSAYGCGWSRSVNLNRHTGAESGGGVQFGSHSAQAEAAAVAEEEAGAAGEGAAQGGEGVPKGEKEATEEVTAVHLAGELSGGAAVGGEAFQTAAVVATESAAVAAEEVRGQPGPQLLCCKEVGGAAEGFNVEGARDVAEVASFVVGEHRCESVLCCAHFSERDKRMQGKIAIYVAVCSEGQSGRSVGRGILGGPFGGGWRCGVMKNQVRCGLFVLLPVRDVLAFLCYGLRGTRNQRRNHYAVL